MLFVVLFLITSCSRSAKWHNQDIPRQQWTVDLAACKNKARRELDKERAMEDMIKAGDEMNDTNSYEKNMSIYTYRRRTGLIIENCMKKLGYEVIP